MGVNPVMRRAVFLDRDGVINRVHIRDGKPYPPADLKEMEILPGVPEAMDRLRKAGFLLIVVTNQPDVARGRQTVERAEAMNRSLAGPLGLDALYVCYHDDEDGCECRKPLPGMLLKAAKEFDLDLKTSYIVGDRWRDIEAGRRCGCTTLLVDYGYTEERAVHPDHRVGSLAEAAEWILERSNTERQ